MERVEAEIRARGESLASFAVRIGVRSQDINNWKHRGIPRTRQKPVADALGWTLDRLLTGEEAGSAMPVHSVIQSASVGGAGSSRAYPGVLGSRAFETRDGESDERRPWFPGQALRLVEGQVVVVSDVVRSPVAFTPDWLAHHGLSEETLALYQAHGDDMEPRIRDGDVLLIDLADRTPTEGGVFLVHYGPMLVVRRIHLGYDGAWILCADHRVIRPDQTVPPAAQGVQVQVIGRVRWRGGEVGDLG